MIATSSVPATGLPMLRGSGITLELIKGQPTQLRHTKQVCTLGPACWSVEGLGDLIDRGMNIARLNFSHGDHDTHAATLERLREACASRPHAHVAVMLDTKGPEIRTGFLAGEEKKLRLTAGQDLELVTDYSFLGNTEQLACSYEALPRTVQVGSRILVADGSLVLTVTEIRETSVMTRVENNATLGERKNMNLPGAVVELPTLTDKDITDITEFGLVQGVDFIALSFCRKGEDIDTVRELLGDEGAHIKIIAKIENQEGLENYDDIVEKADSIMVARGDLGMEIPPEKVFLAQKWMIRKANIQGKPVITATQMLESMIQNPRPTRAEAADVANAVLDGTDCVMLSGETANGSYPNEAVEIMGKICLEAESMINYDSLYQAVRGSYLLEHETMSPAESVASSAVKTAWDVDAKMIIVLTETGNSARLIAKYRPRMPVLVLTGLMEVARQCNGYLKNTHTRVIGSMIGTGAILMRAMDLGAEAGWISPGETAVAVHGDKEAHSGSTNIVRVLTYGS